MINYFQVLGWQTALVSTSYSAALAVQGMIALNRADYTVPAWHGALLTIGAVLLTIVFNTVLLRKLPTFEGGMLVLHVFAFIAVFVVLWVMGDKAPAAQVFTEFSDPQGWGSVSFAFKISGQVPLLTRTLSVQCGSFDRISGCFRLLGRQ
jgi:choline transport protein